MASDRGTRENLVILRGSHSIVAVIKWRWRSDLNDSGCGCRDLLDRLPDGRAKIINLLQSVGNGGNADAADAQCGSQKADG